MALDVTSVPGAAHPGTFVPGRIATIAAAGANATSAATVTAVTTGSASVTARVTSTPSVSDG